MTYRITIGHNFETAHRLASPTAPERCQSIHGHSWWVEVVIASDALDGDDMVVEFGAFKRAWRAWLDANLDHALVLRSGDPMAAAVRSVYAASRIFEMSRSPTTEALAELLFDEAERVVEVVSPGGRVRVERIDLRETRVNAASFDRAVSERRGAPDDFA